MKYLSLISILLFVGLNSKGQGKAIDTLQANNNIPFTFKSLVIPTSLIAFGFIGIESDAIKELNFEIKEEVNENIDHKFTIDNVSQYAPSLAVYALNAIGLKGKNNFIDRTIILSSAYLMMGTTVYGLKKITAIERPDGSSKNSFPSGHTATAFMGAEFIFQEYKDISPWIGISGYAIAAGTGFFRMYNDRHWLTDVAAGAGIGILSTKIAYWTHPIIKKTFFKDKKNVAGSVIPLYEGNAYGLGLKMAF